MAVLYITEFAEMVHVSNKNAPMAKMPPIAEHTVAIGGTTAPSAAFNAKTQYVRIHADAICSIEFGAAPTAEATNMRLAAGQTEYFAVTAGQKVAVITNT